MEVSFILKQLHYVVVDCSNGCIFLTDSLYIDFERVYDITQEEINFLQHDRLFYFVVGLGLQQDMTAALLLLVFIKTYCQSKKNYM